MDQDNPSPADPTCGCAPASTAEPGSSGGGRGGTDLDRRVDEIDYRIQELKQERAALRRTRPAERMSDYAFTATDGSVVGWPELFAGRDELILVHNMGRSCNYCTMWSDGFAGVLGHLEDRAAFVVTSPDGPAVQREVAHQRGWPFRMYSVATDFLSDLGFLDSDGDPTPGASFLKRDDDGSVWRVHRAEFGPGDEFCAVWHLFDLLPRGVDGWEPKDTYGRDRGSRA